MNQSTPHLQRLFAWAEQAATEGNPCAELKQWLAASPTAEREWNCVLEAQNLLGQGEWSVEDPLLTPDQIASYVDGILTLDEARLVEETCFRSASDMLEVLSSARFARQATVLAAATPALTSRLLQLVPGAAGASLPAAPLVVASEGLVSPAPKVRPAAGRKMRGIPGWQVVAGILAATALVGGGVIWLIQANQTPPGKQNGVVKNRRLPEKTVPPKPEPKSNTPDPVPDKEPPALVQEEHDPPLPPPDTQPDQTKNPVVKAPERPPQPEKPPVPEVPQPAPAATEVAVKPGMGVLLVQSSGNDKWRVGDGKYPLTQPIRIVSLAESWTSADIPGMGTLILAGEAELTLSESEDQTLQVRLDHGNVGLHGLPAGKQIQFQTQTSRWTARGVGDYSSLAVVHDPLMPSLYVPEGIIAVDNVTLGKQQFTTLRGGTPAAAKGLSSSDLPPFSPFATNPYDPAWLQPPTEKRRKDWTALYGKVVERLAASDDALAEIQRLQLSAKDARQSALLAEWNLSLTEDEGATLWAMLNHRHELVRLTALRHLLQMHPRDRRYLAAGRLLREKVGDAPADRLAEWLISARRGRVLAPQRALELVENLDHRELAVRQISVFLLEYHTSDTFRQARRKPPAYDADAPPQKRAMAQMEWKAIVAQLYPAARNGKVAP